MKSYDAVVLGLGVMGSAAALHLARRGLRVLGVERWGPAHERGSSFGESRMIRRAYPEHDDYVPLVGRSYELWRELEAGAARCLLLPTGGLVVGRPSAGWLAGALASAGRHGISHQRLSTRALRGRFPALRFAADEEGYLEPDAGVLLAEPCVRVLQEAAAAAGAELRFECAADLEPLRAGWSRGDPLHLGGERVTAGEAVLTLGPWAASLAAADVRARLRVERVLSCWFRPDPAGALFDPASFPFVVLDRGDVPLCLFPMLPRGIKCGLQRSGERVLPEAPLPLRPSEVARLCARLAELAPALVGPPHAAHVGLYTNTEDGHFFLDRHGDALLLSACSGHGFKFAPVLGQAVADLVTTGQSRHALALFSAGARSDRALVGAASQG